MEHSATSATGRAEVFMGRRMTGDSMPPELVKEAKALADKTADFTLIFFLQRLFTRVFPGKTLRKRSRKDRRSRKNNRRWYT